MIVYEIKFNDIYPSPYYAVALYPALLTPNENKIETMFLVVYIHVIQCWVTQNLRFFSAY